MSHEEERTALISSTNSGYQTVQNANAAHTEAVTGVVELCPSALSGDGAGSVSGEAGRASGGGGSGGGAADLIPCRVCGEFLDLTDRADSHVVKCVYCNEATPVRNAPAGKKYVRCPCNCLLICRVSSQRIACPRAACRRVITLPAAGGGLAGAGTNQLSPPLAQQPPQPSVPGMCRITCCYCHDTFLYNSLTNALARCPHCRRVSAVGARFARGRALLFAVLAVVVLLISVGVTAGTYVYSHHHRGIYILYIGGFLSSMVLLMRAIYYCTLRVSTSDRSIDA